MNWNPLETLRKKFGGHDNDSPEPKKEKLSPEAVKLASEGAVPDMAELEKKGLLGKFYRHWKNPAFKKQLQAVAARMKADGVDVKDQEAVKVWVTAHQKEIESGDIESSGVQAVKTFVKAGPSIGRNDPCPCGSKKKYKKCCSGK